MSRFTNSNAVVTCDGSGIIKEVAKRFVAEGGSIVLTGRTLAKVEAAAHEIDPSGARVEVITGVQALVHNLAIELTDDQIRGNAVAPAVVETPGYDAFLTPEQVAAVLPTFKALLPPGHNHQAADVAEAILFLASDQFYWITDVAPPVDGGVMAGRN